MGKFTASFPSGKGLMAVKKIWQKSLAEFSDSEIQEAVAKDVDYFPPDKFFNLNEFKRMCEAVRRRNARAALPAYGGSSDMTNEQWKHWFHRTFGVMPVIASAKPKTNP